MNESWDLYGRGVLFGSLNYGHTDQPWLYCTFIPAGPFPEIEALFKEELRVLERDAFEDWERAYEAIDRPGLELRPANGEPPVTEMLIHIDGNLAWFRY